jgi:hypothetical protein
VVTSVGREPGDPKVAHDGLDELLVDSLSVTVVELRADASPPVATSRPFVNLADDIAQPRPPESSGSMVAPTATGRTLMARPATLDRPAWRHAFTSQGLHQTEQCFWAHHPPFPEQLRRPLHRRKLGFQLGDTTTRCP